MYESLLARLPRELVVEIVLFEGRVTVAYLQEYVSQVYSQVYKRYFGYRHNLEYVTRNKCSLQFYAAWSALIRKVNPKNVKTRKPRGFMRPYVGLVTKVRLEKERLRLACKLDRYFHPETGKYSSFRLND